MKFKTLLNLLYIFSISLLIVTESMIANAENVNVEKATTSESLQIDAGKFSVLIGGQSFILDMAGTVTIKKDEQTLTIPSIIFYCSHEETQKQYFLGRVLFDKIPFEQAQITILGLNMICAKILKIEATTNTDGPESNIEPEPM